MGRITIYIYSGKTGYDVSELVKSVVWSGRKSSVARTIEVSMVDDYHRDDGRVKMALTDGWTCVFKWDNEELFRGIIMKQSLSQAKENKWKAYDICTYLANSKDSFSYSNKTASEIFKDCCIRAGLTVGNVAETGYKIGSLVKPKTTFFDCICEALSITYKNTGSRFYVRTSGTNKIDLLKRKEHRTQWVVEMGEDISSFSYTESIEKIKTRYRIYSKSGSLLKEANNDKLEKAVGTLIEIDTADDGFTEASIKQMVNTMIEESGYPTKSLSLTTIGITSAISGGCLYVIIPQLDINRTFYIDEDKHTFNGEKYTMQVKLNFASDISKAG